MRAEFITDRVDYSGKELRSHWIMERFGIVGDSMVAFAGSCGVSGEDLVDREDFMLGNVVAGESMLHFIVEIFGVGMPGIVFVQRVLCTIVSDLVDSECGEPTVARKGDDLYVGDGKLSVSVATISPVSGLIHLGLNISTAGVPVKAACLDDLGIDHARLGRRILAKFAEEVDSCLDASRKVRPVI